MNLRKLFCALLAVTLAFSACQNAEKPATTGSTAEELQQMRDELQAKRQELQDKQQIAELEKEMAELDAQLKQLDRSGQGGKTVENRAPQSAPNPPAAKAARTASNLPRGQINTGNVVMRSSSSVKSNKLGNFHANEEVEILESQNVSNEGEAIVTQPVKFYASEAGTGEVAYTLPKGKAVVIESFDSDNNQYHVTYQDAKKGRLYATIDANLLETISYSTWYRVRRSNGKEGWVLGKYVNQ
jgi:hypothetical protein